MHRWQDIVINKFSDIYDSQSVVVIDQDSLMHDDYLISQLQQKHYDILNFSKEVSFRYEFEESYRAHWDNGLKTQTVIIVQSYKETEYLPYDLVMKSKEIRLSLMDIFPLLNYVVLQKLDKVFYQKLFIAHQKLKEQNKSFQKSSKETIHFLLRSVFNIDPFSINSNENLVKMLIEKHYAAILIPLEIQEELIHALKHQATGFSIDLQKAFDNKDYFYSWLQEQWFKYVEDIFNLIDGYKPIIDFKSPELFFVIDNLFEEGLISKYILSNEQESQLFNLLEEQKLISIGITSTRNSYSKVNEENMIDLYSLQLKIDQLVKLVEDENDITLRDWLNRGNEFSQLVYQVTSLPPEKYKVIKDIFENVRKGVNLKFLEFLKKSYSAISFYSDNKGPISLARVNQYIDKHRKEKQKTALLVLDGMALDQWFIIKEFIQQHCDLSFNDNRCYAIAPTVTSVSRQSLFSGKLPRYFEESLFTTNKEKNHWEQFWTNKGVRPKRIDYLNVKITDDLAEIKEITDSKNEIFGIVVNFIDDLMHAAKDIQNGKKFFYDSIRSYLGNSNFIELLNILVSKGYKIYITSDHGNIDGIGNGIRAPKDLMESYAKRCVFFDKINIAENFAQQNGLNLFKTNLMPDNIIPVYTNQRELYLRENAYEISHGGLTLEEMIVPFIEVINSDRL
jgi:PglZ domain